MLSKQRNNRSKLSGDLCHFKLRANPLARGETLTAGRMLWLFLDFFGKTRFAGEKLCTKYFEPWFDPVQHVYRKVACKRLIVSLPLFLYYSS
jgi:hypothetical protein